MAIVNLTEEQKSEIAGELTSFFATTYSLYLKTQYFHWNVQGMMFKPLHELFEEQYTDMNEAIDELAERIATLGFRAPGSFEELDELSSISGEEDVPEDYKMVEILIEDHETLIDLGQEVVEFAEEQGDTQTADMVIGRLQAHEKMHWMLRSSLNK